MYVYEHAYLYIYTYLYIYMRGAGWHDPPPTCVRGSCSRTWEPAARPPLDGRNQLPLGCDSRPLVITNCAEGL